MPHTTRPHHVFMQSAETDAAMRGMAVQLAPFLVAYRDTSSAMLAEVRHLVEESCPDGGISAEAAELYAVMAGVPRREKFRILECLELLRGWLENGIVDVTKARSVSIFVGPDIKADIESPPRLALVS